MLSVYQARPWAEKATLIVIRLPGRGRLWTPIRPCNRLRDEAESSGQGNQRARLPARKPDDRRRRADASTVGADSGAPRFAVEFFEAVRLHRLRWAACRHHSEPRGRWSIWRIPAVPTSLRSAAARSITAGTTEAISAVGPCGITRIQRRHPTRFATEGGAAARSSIPRRAPPACLADLLTADHAGQQAGDNLFRISRLPRHRP